MTIETFTGSTATASLVPGDRSGAGELPSAARARRPMRRPGSALSGAGGEPHGVPVL
jgi:hypothetical protein